MRRLPDGGGEGRTAAATTGGNRRNYGRRRHPLPLPPHSDSSPSTPDPPEPKERQPIYGIYSPRPSCSNGQNAIEGGQIYGRLQTKNRQKVPMMEGEWERRNGHERKWQIGPRIMAGMARMMSINNIRRFWNNSTGRIGSNCAMFVQWIHARFMNLILASSLSFAPFNFQLSSIWWFRWFSLASIGLFLLLLVFLLFPSALLHFHFRHPNLPSAQFLVALLAFILLLASINALYAIFKATNPQNADSTAPVRLRPLLFMTSLLPIVGILLLWLPHCLCLHVPFPIGFLQCHSGIWPFPAVCLSLLLSTLIAIRPLLLHWLHQIRQHAIAHRLAVEHPLQSATFFNLFYARMEAISSQNEEDPDLVEQELQLIDQWRRSFGEQLSLAIKEQQEKMVTKARDIQIHMDKVEEEEATTTTIEQQQNPNAKRRRQRKGRKQSILMTKTRENGKQNSSSRNGERCVQFSQLLLLREINCVQNEVGQLVEMDKHQKFVLESIYADFIRDFHLQMSAEGRLRCHSARQIFTRFGPVETMHYTRMTTSEGGYSHGYGGNKGGGGQNDEKKLRDEEGNGGGEEEEEERNAEKEERKIEVNEDDEEEDEEDEAPNEKPKLMRRKRKRGGRRPEKDYATIDSSGETTHNAMSAEQQLKAALVKYLPAGNTHAQSQLSHQAPSYPSSSSSFHHRGRSHSAHVPMPIVPSTPIPQTTPTDPLGPQFADQQHRPSPLAAMGYRAIYENFGAATAAMRFGQQQQQQQQQNPLLKDLKEEDEEVEVEVESVEIDDQRMIAGKGTQLHLDEGEEEEEATELFIRRMIKREKSKDEADMANANANEGDGTGGGGSRRNAKEASKICTCPMGQDCLLILSARASSHYYFLSRMPSNGKNATESGGNNPLMALKMNDDEAEGILMRKKRMDKEEEEEEEEVENDDDGEGNDEEDNYFITRT